MLQISLPWPDKGLSPNARLHRMQRAKLAKSARFAARIMCNHLRHDCAPDDRLHLTIEFRPPDKRRRDLDNMLSACKSTLDGVADALGVDDSQWTLTLYRGQPVNGGAVNITIERIET